MREEIRQKRSTLRSLQKEFSSLKVSLQNELNLIDFAHVSTLFFGIYDKILKSKSSVQQKKFYKLLQESKIENDPEKVIFNFSKYVLCDTEKKLLVKDLNFCLPPKQLKYADYLVYFELFYRDIRNLEILSNEDLDFVKTKTKETALSSFRQYNKKPQQNLSKEELPALTNLGKNKDIIIQKSDKGNSAVIVDKDTYIKRMENLLSDQRKFEKVTLKNDAFLNFVVNQEKYIDTTFKNLVDSNSMSKEMRKFVKPGVTRPDIMYGNCKVHKQQVDGCPSPVPFRQNFSALQTPTYNLAKFLVLILNPLTKNEYTVKDSFQFAEEICEQDPILTMGSLDVESRFTNIPLDETIDVCINQLFENTDTVEGFKKSELKQLLCLATKESYFIFNGLLYKQVDGVAMGSALGPFLANAFLSYYEKNWLNNCPQGVKPVFYRRYADDIILLFKSNDHLEYFQDFLNFCHSNMSFSMETEKENKLSFLDVEVIREQGKFTTTVYRKPTFSDVYSNFGSFLPSVYKFSMLYTLVYRCFRISSNWTQFHTELTFLKGIF